MSVSTRYVDLLLLCKQLISEHELTNGLLDSTREEPGLTLPAETVGAGISELKRPSLVQGRASEDHDPCLRLRRPSQ